MALCGWWLLLNRHLVRARGSWGAAAILAGLILNPTESWAGAWTQPPGALYLKTAIASLESRVRYDTTGAKAGLEGVGQPIRGTEYRLRELRLYAEYGAAPRLTIYGSTAYKQARLTEPVTIVSTRVLPETVRRTTGLGDVQVGARAHVAGQRTPIAVATEVKIPTGYSTSANPALGNGELDVTLRALAGTSSAHWYATADAAWTHRGGAFRNEIAGSIEVGGRLLDFFRLHGVLRASRPVGGQEVSPEDPLFDPATSSPHTTILEIVGGADIAPRATLQFGISQSLSGRNTLAGISYEAGLVWATSTK